MLAGLLGLAALGACGGGEHAADWQDWARESALGLSFAVPPGRVAKVGDRRIELDNPAAYRSADVIELYRDGPPPEIRVGDGPVLREGETPAPFKVRETGSGSGGVNYALSTTKTVDGRNIWLLANFQTEGGVPSFAEVWAVWESLRPAE